MILRTLSAQTRPHFTATAALTALVALFAGAIVGCDDKDPDDVNGPAPTSSTTSPNGTDVGPGQIPTQVGPGPSNDTTDVSPVTGDSTDTNATDTTNGGVAPGDTTDDDTVQPTPSGTRCSEGLQTGSACEPTIDSSTCESTTTTCTCSPTATWTCKPITDTTSNTDNSDTDTVDASITDTTSPSTADSGTGTAPDPTDTGSETNMEWLPSWATTMQRTEDSNEPPPLAGKTLRQFLWPSYSGNEIRIQLSNERGEAAVVLSKVHIARAMPLGQGSIDAATDAQFTWGGSPSVTIAPGELAWSDPLDFGLEEMAPMAVTMHFTSAPNDVTGHPGARTTSYVANGDVVSTASISGETRDRWYFINAIEVMAPQDAYAVAVLGDSITDGYGVLNEFARWPDFLNVAINADPMIADKVSVLNFGMGANSLTVGNQDMDPGIDRFERDVLGRQNKIRWLIVLIGVNDMIYSNVGASAITTAYQEIIDKSHQAGILVYGSPITPFASHTQGAALDVRSQVNTWVTTNGAFDQVIDLAAAVADPSNAAQLAPAFSNDGLHPNTAGYEAMGQAVDLSLFYDTMP